MPFPDFLSGWRNISEISGQSHLKNTSSNGEWSGHPPDRGRGTVFLEQKKKSTTCRLVPEITLTVCSSNHTIFFCHCLVVVSTYLCSHGHKLTFPSTSPIFSIIPRSKIISFIQSIRSIRSIRYQKFGLRASSNSTRQSPTSRAFTHTFCPWESRPCDRWIDAVSGF